MQNRTYLNHVESTRAIAAIAVAIYHFTNHNGPSGYLLEESHRNFYTFGAQGVEIFYIVSGFIIPYSLFKGRYLIKHYFHYVAKRSIRLLPPYLLTIALIVGVGYFLNTYIWYNGYNIQWRNIAANAFFMVDLIQSSPDLLAHFPDNGWINPIFITLKVEFQFYLIIGLILPLMKRHYAILLGVSSLLLLVGIYSIPDSNVFVNAPYFLIGLAAYYIFENGWNWIYASILVLCVISLVGYYVWEDLIAAAIGFSLVLWLPRKMKLLNYTGKISYSFYLIHGLIGGNFLSFTFDTYLFLNYPYLMIIFAILLSWVGAFIIYYCIEKPSILISKKIKYKP